mmetsp:Transcript_75011/g.142169  ORF Transcript_75011/g.142169 Transcript_75011/m.142169 type:complete len:221 (-) Transcript_75011:1964-2626(-)
MARRSKKKTTPDWPRLPTRTRSMPRRTLAPPSSDVVAVARACAAAEEASCTRNPPFTRSWSLPGSSASSNPRLTPSCCLNSSSNVSSFSTQSSSGGTYRTRLMLSLPPSTPPSPPLSPPPAAASSSSLSLSGSCESAAAVSGFLRGSSPLPPPEVVDDGDSDGAAALASAAASAAAADEALASRWDCSLNKWDSGTVRVLLGPSSTKNPLPRPAHRATRP